jgi:hypothetical protein
MPGFMLAHAGDASGFGMLAFVPVGLLLLVGLILVLRPTMTGTGLGRSDDEDDDSAQDRRREVGREPDERRP